MNIVFVSNYFNHHQKPFCEEMYKRLRESFTFIATGIMGEERKKLGYSQDDIPPYVWLAYEGELQWQAALALINTADIVIAGSAPERLLAERIQNGMILLRYSERPFKKKVSIVRRIYHAIRIRRCNRGNRNIYMLCASAYAAKDYASLGLYRNRTYKWGYFPAVKEYDPEALMARKNRTTLMWCGRFIDWKHPDDAVQLAHRLKEEGYDFRLKFVGTGDMDEELRQLVESLGLTDQVSFLGSMPPEQVRIHMEEAGIYLFTSDRQEGWGAVLNESMNSGCAVVASHAIGSAPYLIRDGQNGLIYRSGNLDEMFEKVKNLLENPEEQKRLGLEAYHTVRVIWNAEVATERLLQVADKLLKEEKASIFFADGPLSRAETRI